MVVISTSSLNLYSQFWQGFLYGIGQATQNQNNQNKQKQSQSSSDYLINKYSGKSNTAKIEKTRKIEDDGYVWFKLYKTGGTWGIENTSGEIILSPEYGYINYDEDSKSFSVECEGGCHEGVLSKSGSWIIPLSRKYESVYYDKWDTLYKVKKNGFAGACDENGREIIAPDRYEEIDYWKWAKLYKVKKNGYTGACDENGREIIAPNKYKDIGYFKDGFAYKTETGDWLSIDKNELYAQNNTDNHKNISSVSSSNHATVSSSNSTSASSSDKLLYEGDYTMSNRAYNAGYGYTDAIGGGYEIHVRIYEDYITINGTRYEYSSTSGDWRIYEGVTWLNSTDYYKVNFKNFEMDMFSNSFNQYTGQVNTITRSIVKGKTTFSVENNSNYDNSNTYSNNSNYNSSSNNNSNSSNASSRYTDKTCHGCHGSGKCNTCNGKGWFYGMGSSTKLNCPNCSNGTCSICVGKGTVRGLK